MPEEAATPNLPAIDGGAKRPASRLSMNREICPMKRKSATTILLFCASLCLAGAGLSGCNTVKGAGQDLKSAGQAIERKAEQKKSY